ncbi:tyrosyl-DNA phosphodiesterase 1 isoform X1 [Apium graveolens]|uniref:PNK FHA domain-containing protein n=1 Tax=Apium graveolens TaxID=4045 RepID=A0A6L5BDA5_APIGR|nr:hypothetical protein AG4045_006580 [Apium graveolens]
MAALAPQIGFLVPVNDKLQENTSIPKIPIVHGPNIVGRDSIPVADKRLSRKHLCITASLNAPAHLIVEGSNPVVVRSNDQRKKLLSRESCEIRDGDFVELIPGYHFFKFVCERNSVGSSSQKRDSSGGKRVCEEDEFVSRKRAKQVSQDEVFARSLQAELNHGSPVHGKSIETIRYFSPTKDKLPSTFRLMKVKDLPPWANTNAVSIGDVVQGNIQVALLSNYMVDIDWLTSACTTLTKVPHVLVIHGEGDGTLEYMKRKKFANWILHKPPLPISYGTHHSKAMLLVYPQGVRIIVHTANLIYVDWNNKSQGLWMQDFPWKNSNASNKGSGFENDLVDYLTALKLPEFSVSLPGLGNCSINASFFRRFDYSSATVRLIASVPGYHSGSSLKKWGHMKLRTVLQESTFDQQFRKAPLVYQFSSLGSLDEKWMTELASSMSSGVSEDQKPLGVGEPLIIWPSVEDVRCSLEGYAAGNAIPSPQKNVEKEFLKKYWAKWKASHSGRCHAMPHIKTFARYNGQNLAWFLLTSSNLSKAAWGALQKNNSQLMIRSYELGVLFLPSKWQGCSFSCTDNGNQVMGKCESAKASEAEKTKLVTLSWEGNRNTESSEVITLPVPYELPPQRYSSEDIPWSWDRRYSKRDVHGQVWPRQVQLYTTKD